jgi:hypothetical protein
MNNQEDEARWEFSENDAFYDQVLATNNSSGQDK